MAARIIKKGHELYCQADSNLRRIIELVGEPPTQETRTRKRYEVNVNPRLEERFKDVLSRFHKKHDGEYGIMLILGYDSTTSKMFKVGFKKDLINGKVNLMDNYKTIEHAILRVAEDTIQHDGCYVVDTEGKIYSGYKVDVCESRIFRAFDATINEIRSALFGNPYIGGTRSESGIAAAYLIVGSSVAIVREGNGIYVVQNKGGLVRIPYSIKGNPKPIPGAILNTNLGLEKKVKPDTQQEKILVA